MFPAPRALQARSAAIQPHNLRTEPPVAVARRPAETSGSAPCLGSRYKTDLSAFGVLLSVCGGSSWLVVIPLLNRRHVIWEIVRGAADNSSQGKPRLESWWKYRSMN